MRSEAEASLRHLTLTLFSRVHVILNHQVGVAVSEVPNEQHLLINSPEGIQLITTKILTVNSKLQY